jgi:cell division protein FtsX
MEILLLILVVLSSFLFGFSLSNTLQREKTRDELKKEIRVEMILNQESNQGIQTKPIANQIRGMIPDEAEEDDPELESPDIREKKDARRNFFA